MENKTKAALVLGGIAAVLLLRKKTTTTPQADRYKFVAAKDGTPAYISPYTNGQWVPDFSKAAMIFKSGQTISNLWLGEIELISNEGIKTAFYIVEIQIGFLGVTFPVAVKMTDVLRYVV
jgi:hypothetical protein